MYGYIYKTTNLVTGKIYIGQHKYTKSELDPNYLGSGIILKEAIEKYGKENFKCEVLEYCSSLDDLNAKEIYYIRLFNSTNETVGYNLSEGGKGCLNSDIQKQAVSSYMKNRIISDSTHLKMKLSAQERVKYKNMPSQKDLPWISNGVIERKLLPNEIIPEGFEIHKRVKNDYVVNKCKNKYSNGCYVHKDNETKFVSNIDLEYYLSNGYSLGKSRNNYSTERNIKLSNSKKGTICINDGYHNKYIKPELLEEYLKLGYSKGKCRK